MNNTLCKLINTLCNKNINNTVQNFVQCCTIHEQNLCAIFFNFIIVQKHCAIFCVKKCNTGNVGNTKTFIAQFCIYCSILWTILERLGLQMTVTVTRGRGLRFVRWQSPGRHGGRVTNTNGPPHGFHQCTGLVTAVALQLRPGLSGSSLASSRGVGINCSVTLEREAWRIEIPVLALPVTPSQPPAARRRRPGLGQSHISKWTPNYS